MPGRASAVLDTGRRTTAPLRALAGLFVTALLGSPQPAGAARGDLRPAIDRDPDPRVFSTRLVARPVRRDLDGDGSKEEVWSFNGSVPGPEIRVRVGDVVRVRFRNKLPLPSSIHWHGVEVTHRSDGTSVSQNEVPPGGSFRYEFRVTRPGVFWYHPHVRPSNQVWRGLYGPLIVEDPAAGELAAAGVIPVRDHTVVLSDVTVCKTPGANDEQTFPADPSLPWAGGGEFPGHALSPSPRELCETPRDATGRRVGEPLPAGVIPFVQAPRGCVSGRQPCRVNPGQWVLTNGGVAAGREGSPRRPGPLVGRARPLAVGSGEGLRLRLINASLIRFYRLLLTDARGRRVPLLRIGGEGGLLNRARLEGGSSQGFTTGYDRGEVLLGPGQRADLVLVPEGEEGEVLTLWTRDFAHTGRGFALTPTVPVLHFAIDGKRSPAAAFSLARRAPLLRHPRVARPLENLRRRPPTAGLVDPATLSSARLPGTASPEIRFTNSNGPSIDDVIGIFDAAAVSDFRQVPLLPSSRYARVGGLLELSVTNETAAHHVFHLHGFSFQPVRLELGRRVVYRYRYPEFVDSVDIPAEHRLVFKVRLADRPRRPGRPGLGGAVGRWLLHCHLLPHAAQGMIAELVVLP
ncbi:MAG: multicopper oxidase family protein [Thermoanaerobaculia bacterium]|nr:multicopper oxidase family protein [Thermoanaerobaculia bacterium]